MEEETGSMTKCSNAAFSWDGGGTAMVAEEKCQKTSSEVEGQSK